MIVFRKLGIRRRLALLYSGIFAVILSVFCAILFQYFQRTQSEAFDSMLYNFAVDFSANLEMDFVGRLFVVNPNVSEVGKYLPFTVPSSFFMIRDSRGKVLMHSRSLGDRSLPLNPAGIALLGKQKHFFETIRASSLGVKSTTSELRLLTYLAHHADWREPLILQIAVPMELPMQEQRDLLLFFLISIPAFLLVAGFAGLWMSKRALLPVQLITLKAKSITGVEKLKERIPVSGAEDEIHELAVTINSLLDRLDKAFASQDRFISNASHQLKTPLTILKGELDFLRKSPPAQNAEVQGGLDSATAEINRLIQLVQDLLLLARLEAGRDTITLAPVRLDEAVLKVVARIQKLAKNKSVQLHTQFSAETQGQELEAEVMGDEELLESMLENFLENAVKYSPENSTIELNMRTRPDVVEVTVRDQGPGIPEDLRQKIFERFTRVKPSNIVPGSGLGLSIAAEIARIHQAQIDLSAPPGGRGTQVNVRFRRVSSNA
ncbi:MAG: HAMP domain-containing histidine kinase [Bdellovibrionales bacterium]|nr:HAMP domain-containing histidine kinase [Bdellovibrionales bacterium]